LRKTAQKSGFQGAKKMLDNRKRNINGGKRKCRTKIFSLNTLI
jgi:hypothetical protein